MLENRNQQQFFCLMKELIQRRLPPSFGLHPQKCDEREHRNSRSFAPDLPSALKDLSIVDLFSVYFLSCVDTVICYIETDFMFALPPYVRYIKEFVISRLVISRFYSMHFTVTLAGT